MIRIPMIYLMARGLARARCLHSSISIWSQKSPLETIYDFEIVSESFFAIGLNCSSL